MSKSVLSHVLKTERESEWTAMTVICKTSFRQQQIINYFATFKLLDKGIERGLAMRVELLLKIIIKNNN